MQSVGSYGITLMYTDQNEGFHLVQLFMALLDNFEIFCRSIMHGAPLPNVD